MAGGLVLAAGLLVAVLTDSRPRLAATNSKVIVSGVELVVLPGHERCQGGVFVPKDAARLRLYVGASGRPTGQPLLLAIRARGGEPVSSLAVPADYRPGPLDVAMRPPPRPVEQGTFCVSNVGDAPMAFAGNLTPDSPDAGVGPNDPGSGPGDEVRVDFFRPGRESWLELAPAVARRFSLFKPSFAGPWTMWAALAVVLVLWGAVVALVSRASAARTAGLTRAGWACAAIAAVNAAVWAIVIPPHQVIDEPSHASYAEYLVENHRPPPLLRSVRILTPHLSESNEAIVRGLPFSLEGRPSWSEAQDRALRGRLDDLAGRDSGAGSAANYPSLYYGVEAVPAALAGWMNPLDTLFVMRLVSALLAGVTVAFVFLFLRELLPRTPWAWTVGALAVGFQPVFGFMAGGVNNDNLLYAASAAFLFLMARALRHGPTLRLGAAIGATAAIGLLAKPSMVALLPGAVLGLVLVVVKARPERRRLHLLGAGAAAVVFLVAVGAWFAVEATFFDRPVAIALGALARDAARKVTTWQGQVSYLWQFFLPPLPFMQDAFPTYPRYPLWDVYVRGFIGRFGWFQYEFPMRVNQVGLGVLLGLGVLAALGLARARDVVRRRWIEVAAFSAMLLGMVLFVGITGYRFRAVTELNFEQPRYLFPCLALYGGVVALASRGAGRRWGPAVGAFLVVLAMTHSLFAMLLTVARYYA